MHLRIAAISDEPIYPSSFLPRTLIDILKVLAKLGCSICLLQPGNSNSVNDDESFHVITFSKTPNFLAGFFNSLKRKNEPMFKAAASWLNPNVYRTLWNQARSADILMVYDVQYAIQAVIASKITKKPVIMLGDIMYISYYRGTNAVSRIFLYFLLAWEKTAIKGVNTISVWGPDDRDFLLSSGISDKKIRIVPLSIDLNRIDQLSSETNREHACARIKELKEKGFTILMFHGNLDYTPNRSSVDYIINELAPDLFGKYENIAFVVVGASSRTNYPSDDRIFFTGRVDNLFSCISLADMGIVPLTFGAGVKNKVLEYFALSKPVVTTAIGAENLRVTNMVNCLVTTIRDFSGSISFLLENPKVMARLGTNGRKYIEEYHSLGNYEKFLEMGKELIQNN